MTQTKRNQALTVQPIVKYLHVIASLNPEGGGPAEGVRQLCAAASALGHHVEIVTLDPPDAPWAKALPFPVHQLGPGHLGKYGYNTRLTGWLGRNASRFEAVIVNGLWQYPGFAVWRALRGSSIPYFVFTHGMLDPWFKHRYPLKHLKKCLYWPWAEYRVLRDARAVLFTCEEERRQARKSFGLYRVNESVVSYGSPGPTGDKGTQRSAFLSRFPELVDKRVLLFLGRIHPKKGCDLLIDAFAEVAHRDRSLHLVMAGPDSGGWRPELMRSLEKAGLAARVTWTGMLEGNLKWGAFHAAEAFVLPSHQENFGISVAEALACGVPVLISDKVNIWREIRDDEAGFVGRDDAQGTLQLLRNWLALGEFERERLARNAALSFRNRFHIDAAAHSLLDAIQRTPVPAWQPSSA